MPQMAHTVCNDMHGDGVDDLPAVGGETETTMACARANLYGFLVRLCLQEPDREWCRSLSRDPLRAALVDVFGREAGMDGFLQDAGLAADDGARMEDLVVEFHSLFTVPGPLYLTPYESCYREKKADGSPGCTWGRTTREVRAFYRHLGAAQMEDVAELPDHLGVELGFMQYLVAWEGRLEGAGREKETLQLRLWQRRFLNEHLLAWVPELTEKMRTTAASRFYRGLAFMLETFLKVDAEYLKEGH